GTKQDKIDAGDAVSRMGAGGELEAAADGALPQAPRRGALLLRPDHRHRHAAGGLLREGNDGFLSARQIRIFDYPRFAEPLRDRVRDRAAELASAAGVTIEHIAKKHIRKEEVVAKVLTVRGDHPGLVHIISAMEANPRPPAGSGSVGANGASHLSVAVLEPIARRRASHGRRSQRFRYGSAERSLRAYRPIADSP